MFAPKAILFDFGGTLDSNGRHWLERVRPFYAALGLPSEGEAFDRAFYDADDRLAERHRLDGLDMEEVVNLQVRDVLKNLGADPGLAERVAGPFVRDSRAWLARSRSILERLRSRRRLAIVSNFYGNMPSMLDREGLRPLFDFVADSGAVGVSKPEPAIFQAALDSLGTQPSEALMVGDSIPRDMVGAERLGMPHAWLAGDRTSPACCAGAAVLRSLEELEFHLTEAP